jgi:hypothetical protein
MLFVIVGAPIKGLRFEGEPPITGSAGVEDFKTGGNDFFSDTVSGDGGDFIGFHFNERMERNVADKTQWDQRFVCREEDQI